MYRTVYRVVVLSEEQPPDDMDIADLHYECNEGEYVGTICVQDGGSLSGKQMADELYAAGSEPEFFNLDDDGNRVEL